MELKPPTKTALPVVKHVKEPGKRSPTASVTCICSAEHHEKAKEVAYMYMSKVNPGGCAAQEDMVPTPLSPTGSGEPTHYACFMPRMCVEAAKQLVEQNLVINDGYYLQCYLGLTKREALERFSLKEIK